MEDWSEYRLIRRLQTSEDYNPYEEILQVGVKLQEEVTIDYFCVDTEKNLIYREYDFYSLDKKFEKQLATPNQKIIPIDFYPPLVVGIVAGSFMALQPVSFVFSLTMATISYTVGNLSFGERREIQDIKSVLDKYEKTLGKS